MSAYTKKKRFSFKKQREGRKENTITIQKAAEGSRLTLTVVGQIDTGTAPELEAAVQENIEDVTELVFDFKEVEYISSAGLRVLMSAHSAMTAKEGSMKLTHVNDMVGEILDMTGLSGIFTFEADK